MLQLSLYQSHTHTQSVHWSDGYDTIEEFNVDSEAECDQLNLAHETKTSLSSIIIYLLSIISIILSSIII